MSLIDLIERIEAAFNHRQIPAKAVELEGRVQIDSDVEDATWFEGRDWREITADDWQKHNCAVIFLSDEAFAYYLPSLLAVTVQNPNGCPDLAVGSLIYLLDREPNVKEWDLPFTNRFLQFRTEEYEVLKEWLLFACEIVSLRGWGISASGPGDRFGRAFDNVNLLQQVAQSEALIQELSAIWRNPSVRYLENSTARSTP